MATHSSILALEIPWTEEPGELQSTGSQVTKNKLCLDVVSESKKTLSDKDVPMDTEASLKRLLTGQI